MTVDRRKRTGAAGEAAAAEHLRSAGYDIVDRNWRCRFGEVDLVAAKDGALVFVEVRARSANTLSRFGAPLESITPKKRLTLRRCAEAYLQQRRGNPPAGVRFDCVGVVLDSAGSVESIHHIVHAF